MWGSIVIKLWGEKGRNPQRIQAEAYMSGIYHLKQCCGGGGGVTQCFSAYFRNTTRWRRAMNSDQ